MEEAWKRVCSVCAGYGSMSSPLSSPLLSSLSLKPLSIDHWGGYFCYTGFPHLCLQPLFIGLHLHRHGHVLHSVLMTVVPHKHYISHLGLHTWSTPHARPACMRIVGRWQPGVTFTLCGVGLFILHLHDCTFHSGCLALHMTRSCLFWLPRIWWCCIVEQQHALL